MMLICSVPKVTPVIPPRKPKITIEKTRLLNPGSPQGARRSGWYREGPKWLEARIYEDREAELHERVDRRRVRLAYVAAAERSRALEEVRVFRQTIARLQRQREEADLDLVRMCEAEKEAAL